jgi:hypothetical protein
MRSRSVLRLSMPFSVIAAATLPTPDWSMIVTEMGDACLAMPVIVP